jgi:sulfoxide reductase catalytic subunit YedY
MSNKAFISQAEYFRLAILHRWLAIGTGVLLLTGLLLYAEPLRGVLAPVRVPLKYIHILSGLLLACATFITVVDWGRYLIRSGLALGRRLNTVLSIIWIIGWTVTGLLMWLQGVVSYTISNGATMVHGWLTWLSLPWVVGHIAFRLQHVRRPDGRIELAEWLARPTTRRGFLSAALAMVAVWGVGKLWVQSRLGADPEVAGAVVDPSTLQGGGMKGRFRLYFVNNTIPKFDPETWRLQVGDKSLSWADFTSLSPFGRWFLTFTV